MTRPTAVLVVLLKPCTSLIDLAELAEILKYHPIVQTARLELGTPGLAKARARVGNVARRGAR